MDQRIGEPQLDEGLTRDADASGFSIDRAQQVDGEVDVDTLDFAARTTTLRQIFCFRRHGETATNRHQLYLELSKWWRPARLLSINQMLGVVGAIGLEPMTSCV
jgi:hypothetical protein